jgi:polyhydroxybutyrate depolymerase
VWLALFAAGCAGSSGVAPAEPAAPAPAAPDAPLAAEAGPSAAAVPAAAPVAAQPAEVAPGRAVPPSPSSGCGKAAKAGGPLVMRTGSVQTPYLLTLPEGYDGKTPVPLVFAFHGRTRSHVSMHDTDASHLADELGKKYAVAYVKSVGPGFDQPREQRDNLQIYDALHQHLLENYCVDTEQVFALGHSSGGLFSELLSCERSSQLRGIAAVAGAMVRPECPGRTAALIIHGERDAVVSVSRGQAARDHFLAANGCSAQSSAVGAPGCAAYSGCEPSSPVEWCEHGEPTYQDTNHGWPSFASAEIARFFGTLERVPHAAGSALLSNESFDAGSEPWQVAFMGKAKGKSEVKNGALCATLDSAGENPWDAQLGYAGLPAQTGRTYAIDYRLWTSAPTDVRVKLGLDAPPYKEYWQQNVAATPEPQRVKSQLRLVEQAPGTLGLGFQFAGTYARKVPVTLCIDEVSITALPEG